MPCPISLPRYLHDERVVGRKFQPCIERDIAAQCRRLEALCVGDALRGQREADGKRTTDQTATDQEGTAGFEVFAGDAAVVVDVSAMIRPPLS